MPRAIQRAVDALQSGKQPLYAAKTRHLVGLRLRVPGLRKAAKRDIPRRQELDSETDRDGTNPITGWVGMSRRDHDERLHGLELQANRLDVATLRDELIRGTLVDLPGMAHIGEEPGQADPDALGVPSLAILPLAHRRSRANASGTTLEDFTHRSYLPSIRAGAATPLHGRVVDEDPACWDGAPTMTAATGSSGPSIAAPVEVRHTGL